MTYQLEPIRQRDLALVAAERERADSTRDAEIEYSETVAKLRERFEADIAEAGKHRIARVRVAHRTYNRSVVAAERPFAGSRT